MVARRLTAMLLTLALAAALIAAVLDLPLPASGLEHAVLERLEESGVRNPVTAVLLNFRGYDTLLEFGVLLLAAVAARALAPAGLAQRAQPALRAAVLDALVRVVVPLMILVAGYLLWVGAYAPGGAFQAGALLAAAATLMLLAGAAFPTKLGRWPVRAALALGPLVTLLVALGVMAAGGHLMQYPPARAGGYILIIEAAAMLSIAASLVVLLVLGAPERDGDRPLSAPQDREP